jgi:hypothetical protein
MLRGYIEKKARAWHMSETDALNRIVEDARLAELEGSPKPTVSKNRDSGDSLTDDIFGEMV